MATTNTNSNTNYTGNVQKYIGSAYDQMREIYVNLEDLLVIVDSMKDGSFYEVAGIADEIQGLIDKVDNFNSTYYGALDYVPILDPNGDPITEGDLYYDLNLRLMQVYVTGDWWIPLGAVNHTVIRVVLDQSHFQGDEIIVPLGIDQNGRDYAYIPSTNSLSVHLEGLLLLSTYVSQAAGAYTETSDKSITIHPTRLSHAAEVGQEVALVVGTEAATVTHVGKVGQYRHITKTAGETTVQLPDGVSYIPGTHNLTVHVKINNGTEREMQVVADDANPLGDYFETSPTTYTLRESVPQSTEITSTIGHIVANDDRHFAVIMANEAPDVFNHDEGQLWFRTSTGRMYILYFDDVPLLQDEITDGSEYIHQNRQWVSITPEDTVIGPEYEVPLIPATPVIHGTIFQDVAPDPTKHAEGTLWFNIKTGNLHIKYQDLDSQQWVKVST